METEQYGLHLLEVMAKVRSREVTNLQEEA